MGISSEELEDLPDLFTGDIDNVDEFKVEYDLERIKKVVDKNYIIIY